MNVPTDTAAPSPQVPEIDMLPVIIRLADEGIPIRAIARTTLVPSDELYLHLREAIDAGTLLEMPRDDWPVGTLRHNRAVFYGTPLEQAESLKFACARFFKASPLEAAMLGTMLKRNEVTKSQLHQVIEQNRPDGRKEETDEKMVDVMICKLRKKLKKFDIVIETMWGMGYLIPPDHRERAINMLMSANPVPQVSVW
jgi:Transcriptional regulatory protein, C terminal